MLKKIPGYKEQEERGSILLQMDTEERPDERTELQGLRGSGCRVRMDGLTPNSSSDFPNIVTSAYPTSYICLLSGLFRPLSGNLVLSLPLS